MAASGLVLERRRPNEVAGKMDFSALDRRVPRVRLLKMQAIFQLEKNGVRNASSIAKCLEKLNGRPPANILHQDFAGLFCRENFPGRLIGRSPSTDSIAVSNFSGSVDSQDSNSGQSSPPSSPEEPDRSSRANSPHLTPQNQPISRPPYLPADKYDAADLLENSSGAVDAPKSDIADASDLKSNIGDSNFLKRNISAISIPKSNIFNTNFTRRNICGAPQSDIVTAAPSTSSSSSSHQQCGWTECDVFLEDGEDLAEHIRLKHVLVQKDKGKNFVCLWTGCKVYNRTSSSIHWLERHMDCHSSGTRPFRCIVGNCCQRFPSQAALQRHVNSHFEGGATCHRGKCRDEVAVKSLRRKRNNRGRKRQALGKTEDFFDANIMEQIRYKLVEGHSEDHPRLTTFYSKIKAIRTEKSGQVNVLLQWTPENISTGRWTIPSPSGFTSIKKDYTGHTQRLPECWVPEKCVVHSKQVRISKRTESPERITSPRPKQRRK